MLNAKKYRNMMCKNRHKFCYVCGLFVDTKHRLKFENNKALVEVYNELFKRTYTASSWFEPEYICTMCSSELKQIKTKTNKDTQHFSSPMVWQYQLYHKPEDCYFCQTNVTGYNYKTRNNIKYADVLTVSKPVPFNDSVTIIETNELNCNNSDLPTDFSECENSDLPTDFSECENSDTEFLPVTSHSSAKLHLITSADYKDIIRDFKLSSRQSEGLASRLKQWNVVDSDFRITLNRSDVERMCFKQFFEEDENQTLVYCTDVKGLFSAFQHDYVSHDWRLFIDGSCRSNNCLIKFKFFIYF